MAYENMSNPVTGTLSTGIKPYRAVVMGSGGTLGYPANGQPIDGVVVDAGSTGSTADGQYSSIAYAGLVKMEAAASTAVKAGRLVISSSIGQASALATGKHAIGRVWSGSSGAAGRIVTVLLSPVGSTVAPT